MLLFLLGINVNMGPWHKESQMFMLTVIFFLILSDFKPPVYKVMKDLSFETKTWIWKLYEYDKVSIFFVLIDTN